MSKVRLIDADALKKELEAMANNEWNIQVGSSKGLEDAIDVIDNAPTVEPYCYFCGQKEHGIRPQVTVCCENADGKTVEELKAELERVINEGRPQGEQIAWEQGYECGKNESRPKGEWKLHGMIYYCSECGHECGESGDNFCGNCGSDMRGKE